MLESSIHEILFPDYVLLIQWHMRLAESHEPDLAHGLPEHFAMCMYIVTISGFHLDIDSRDGKL